MAMTDEQTPAPPATGDRGGGQPLGPVIAVMLLGVLGGILVLMLGQGEQPAGEQTLGLVTTTTPAVDGPATDTFSRSDTSTLAFADNGAPWDEMSGGWTTLGGQAVLDRPSGAVGVDMALVDMGATDGEVSALAAFPRDGAGLVFRAVDIDTYWVVQPASAFATWIVREVMDGQVLLDQSLGLQSAASTTITVQLQGPSVIVTLGGGAPTTFDDPDVPDDATRVGFVADGPGADEARWDDLVTVPAS